jgi:hypothetical protein
MCQSGEEESEPLLDDVFAKLVLNSMCAAFGCGDEMGVRTAGRVALVWRISSDESRFSVSVPFEVSTTGIQPLSINCDVSMRLNMTEREASVDQGRVEATCREATGEVSIGVRTHVRLPCPWKHIE